MIRHDFLGPPSKGVAAEGGRGMCPTSAPAANARVSRRTFLATTAAAATATLATRAQTPPPFQLRYSLASCMYGTLPLETIFTQAHEIDAPHIDLWPAKHGNQWEQLQAMGVDAYLTLCEKHAVNTAIVTRYDLGPFKLANEFPVVSEIGATIMVAGSEKPADDERTGVKSFVERLKPHLAKANEHGIHLGIENHANALIHSPDSIRYLVDELDAQAIPNAGIAFAPYHLPQDTDLMADLMRHCGPRLLHFYAWEHGHGCHDPLPKALEMQQLPGYGSLDFGPILQALKDIDYQGLTTIFMHPVPRGIPILPTAEATTAAIDRSREYLTWKAGRLD